MRSARSRVEIDIDFTEREIEALRPVAAYLNLTLEETASMLIEAGFQQMLADLGAESYEDIDRSEAIRYLLEEGERGGR